MTNTSLTQNSEDVQRNLPKDSDEVEVYVNLGGEGVNSLGLTCTMGQLKAFLKASEIEVVHHRFDEDRVMYWVLDVLTEDEQSC